MAASAMSEENSALASQCMAFCQALASKGQTFSFTINVGSSFSFSLDTRGDGSSTMLKKKKSPSTVRRNARRRAAFLDKKLVPSSSERKSSAKETTPEKEAETENKNVFKCDQCDHDFKTKNGLKIHVGKAHKKANSTPATPDCLRQQSRSSVSLSASPLLDNSREEFPPVSPDIEDPPEPAHPHSVWVFCPKAECKVKKMRVEIDIKDKRPCNKCGAKKQDDCKCGFCEDCNYGNCCNNCVCCDSRHDPLKEEEILLHGGCLKCMQ